MKTKQEIKDDYACSRGFRNWEDLKAHTKDLDCHIDELMNIKEYETVVYHSIPKTDEWGWRNMTFSRDDYYESQNNWDDGIKHFKD